MRLAQFWSDLEDHFPPAGVRLSLATRLGREDFELLSRLGVFVPRGVAQRYPCPRPGGEQCPRRVVDMRDGTYDAVCDNDPPECKDVCGLSAHDVEQIALDVPTLGLKGAFTGHDLRRRMSGHVLAEAKILVRYAINPAAWR